MRGALCLFSLFLVAYTTSFFRYAGADLNYVLNKFNDLRSKTALGIEPFPNKTCAIWPVDGKKKFICVDGPTNKTYPKAAKMYQLKWDPTMATQAFNRLSTMNMTNSKLKGSIPKNVGEITFGIAYGIATSNKSTTGKNIFDFGWKLWLNYHTWTGITPLTFNWTDIYVMDGFKTQREGIYNSLQLIAGATTKVGCAYMFVNIGAGQYRYAVICHFTPFGLTVGSLAYPQGPKSCSACPTATAPCNSATGLCVMK